MTATKQSARIVVPEWFRENQDQAKRLTPRERAICRGVAAVEFANSLALALGCKAGTVNNRRSQIAHKLGTRPSQLAAWSAPNWALLS